MNKLSYIILALAFVFSACSKVNSQRSDHKKLSTFSSSENDEIATLAGGCFW